MLVDGVYQDVLKNACVTPILKSENPCDINNYRPIRGLQLLNIIFENLCIVHFLSLLMKINY